MTQTTLRSFRPAFLSLSALASLLITGCGLGTPAGPTATTIQSMAGVVHGGQSAIQGSRVVLYHTAPSGTTYGSGAVVIGTALSGVDGSFQISPSATSSNCPAGQQAYITAAGGYQTGQNTLDNTQMLEIAALGDCSTISSSTFIQVNEVTTVAAGFALSGFITTAVDATYTDGLTNAIYAANIGAPTGNNSATTATLATLATAPAGLAHAFMNAATLANVISGLANSSVTVSTAGTTTTGAVPQTMINSLANALQACVDSASTPASTSTTCTSLFTDTLSLSGKTPTNTLQSMVYLARNPYTAAGVNATTGLVPLAKTFAAFQPALTANPADWSMAILYHNNLAAPYFVALDANDTAYFGLTTTSSTTPAIFGISAYGNSVPLFASQSSGTTTRGLAPDTLGNIWVANNGTGVDRFVTSSGALAGTYTSTVGSTWPVAVDKQNNMWVGHVASGTGVNIDEAAYSAGVWTANYTASPGANTGSYGLAIDASQNIWSAGYYSSGNDAILIPNGNTVAAPSYGTGTTATAVVQALNGTTPIKPYSVAFDASGNAWYAVYGAPSTATTGIEKVVANAALSATTLTPGTLVAGTTAGTNGLVLGTSTALELAIDGAGTLFIPDNTTSGVHMYSTITSNTLTPSAGLRSAYETVSSVTVTAGAGCTSVPTVSFSGPGTGASLTLTLPTNPGGVGTSSTTYTLVGGTGYTTAPTATVSGGGCTTTPTVTPTVATIYNPRQVAIDSTGSIWFGFTTGGATEIIGVAAPSYPTLSVGNPGLSPGLSAVNTLP